MAAPLPASSLTYCDKAGVTCMILCAHHTKYSSGICRSHAENHPFPPITPTPPGVFVLTNTQAMATPPLRSRSLSYMPGCGLLPPLSVAGFLNPAVLGLVLGTTKSRSSSRACKGPSATAGGEAANTWEQTAPSGSQICCRVLGCLRCSQEL